MIKIFCNYQMGIYLVCILLFQQNYFFKLLFLVDYFFYISFMDKRAQETTKIEIKSLETEIQQIAITDSFKYFIPKSRSLPKDLLCFQDHDRIIAWAYRIIYQKRGQELKNIIKFNPQSSSIEIKGYRYFMQEFYNTLPSQFKLQKSMQQKVDYVISKIILTYFKEEVVDKNWQKDPTLTNSIIFNSITQESQSLLLKLINVQKRQWIEQYLTNVFLQYLLRLGFSRNTFFTLQIQKQIYQIKIQNSTIYAEDFEQKKYPLHIFLRNLNTQNMTISFTLSPEEVNSSECEKPQSELEKYFELLQDQYKFYDKKKEKLKGRYFYIEKKKLDNKSKKKYNLIPEGKFSTELKNQQLPDFYEEEQRFITFQNQVLKNNEKYLSQQFQNLLINQRNIRKQSYLLLFMRWFSNYSIDIKDIYDQMEKDQGQIENFKKLFNKIFQTNQAIESQVSHNSQRFLYRLFQKKKIKIIKYRFHSFDSKVQLGRFIKMLAQIDVNNLFIITMNLFNFFGVFMPKINGFIMLKQGKIAVVTLEQLTRQLQPYIIENYKSQELSLQYQQLKEEKYFNNLQQFNNRYLLNLSIYYPQDELDESFFKQNIQKRLQKFSCFKTNIPLENIKDFENKEISYILLKILIQINLGQYKSIVLQSVQKLKFYPLLQSVLRESTKENLAFRTIGTIIFSLIYNKDHDIIQNFMRIQKDYIIFRNSNKLQTKISLLQKLEQIYQNKFIDKKILLQTIVKEVLLQFFQKHIQEFNKSQLCNIMNTIMVSEKYQLVTLEMNQAPSLGFISQFYKNLDNELSSKKQISLKNVIIITTYRDGVFAMLQCCDQSLTIMNSNSLFVQQKDYLEIIKKSIAYQGKITQNFYTSFVYTQKRLDAKKNLDSNLLQLTLKSALQQTLTKVRKDFSLKLINNIKNEIILQRQYGLNGIGDVERIKNQRFVKSSSLHYKMIKFYQNQIDKIHEQSKYDQMMRLVKKYFQSDKKELYPLVKQQRYQKQDYVCAIIDIISSVRKEFHEELFEIFEIDPYSQQITFNYYQMQEDESFIKQKRKLSIKKYFLIYSRHRKEKPLIQIFHYIFKIMIIRFIDELINAKANGYNYYRVCSILFGPRFATVKIDFIPLGETTQYEKIVKRFINIKQNGLKQYKCFPSFQFDQHIENCQKMKFDYIRRKTVNSNVNKRLKLIMSLISPNEDSQENFGKKLLYWGKSHLQSLKQDKILNYKSLKPVQVFKKYYWKIEVNETLIK